MSDLQTQMQTMHSHYEQTDKAALVLCGFTLIAKKTCWQLV
ncbi:MAG: hypothetical protein ACJAZ1_000780 [Yoonia sp.]|jgi:hypothetical protein